MPRIQATPRSWPAIKQLSHSESFEVNETGGKPRGIVIQQANAWTFHIFNYGIDPPFRIIHAESPLYFANKDCRRPSQHPDCWACRPLRLPEAARRSPRAEGTRCAGCIP